MGCCLLLFLALPSQADLWIHSSQVKQGQSVLVSGLKYDFPGGSSSLSECSLKFQNKTYPFYRDIVNYALFKESNEQSGFQYVARLASTPLTPLGKSTLTLRCPKGTQDFSIEVIDVDFPVQHITLSKSKSSLKATPKELASISKALHTKTPYRLWSPKNKWSFPSSAPQSTAYGVRRTYNGVFAKNYFHKGLDFAAAEGTPVKAPAAGKVILLGLEKGGFVIHGNCLAIDHGQGIVTVYLHLSEILVAQGQMLEANQIIAKVGSTGISTGPHLHFGLYVNGLAIDPSPWLMQAQY